MLVLAGLQPVSGIVPRGEWRSDDQTADLGEGFGIVTVEVTINEEANRIHQITISMAAGTYTTPLKNHMLNAGFRDLGIKNIRAKDMTIEREQRPFVLKIDPRPRGILTIPYDMGSCTNLKLEIGVYTDALVGGGVTACHDWVEP